MWDFIMWIVIGGLAGWIASIIMGRNAQQGLLLNIIVGVIGAAIGGWLISLLGMGDGGFIWSLLVAVLGSVVLLAIVGFVTKRT